MITDAVLQAEWLEADGEGGFASGTVNGVRTRRYHALLLTATTPPTGRMVLVNGLEAWLENAAGQQIALSSQHYPPDVTYPDGWRLIQDFTRKPWPTWRFGLPDGGFITHEIFTARDACATVLRWRQTGGGQWILKIRPLLSGRDYHALHHENPNFNFSSQVTGSSVVWRPYPGVPAITAQTNGAYAQDPEWYRNFLYTQERDRGLDDAEDLASPGIFTFALETPASMILRAGPGTSLQADDLAALERARRGADTEAASYLVTRGAGRTVLAGFPWFTDWGRDSFIALRGLCIATGRLDDAEKILLAWAGLVDQGMLPNRFPDEGGPPDYNSVDASLWFIVAVHDFLNAAPPDPATEKILGAAAQKILTGYAAGTRYGIKADTDGLLHAGVPGVNLTWMDAKIGDNVVTPRIGKPVEINALWINALRIAARWTADWAALEARATAAFCEKFPAPGGGLYDVVDADHVAGKNDASLRPNQIFAVGGLPFAVIDGVLAHGIVALVEANLLTPIGLRSLAPTDPAYIGTYRGGPAARDAAYHQGTVWPWLLGAFVQAWLRVNGASPANRVLAAARFLAPLQAHLETFGLGHIAEVADGDAPHLPGGCPFQAWSLGEMLRIGSMLRP
jgi:predicted glycogen debranching enzyme